MDGNIPAITRVLHTSAGVEHSAAKNPETNALIVCTCNPSSSPVVAMTLRLAWLWPVEAAVVSEMYSRR